MLDAEYLLRLTRGHPVQFPINLCVTLEKHQWDLYDDDDAFTTLSFNTICPDTLDRRQETVVLPSSPPAVEIKVERTQSFDF